MRKAKDLPRDLGQTEKERVYQTLTCIYLYTYTPRMWVVMNICGEEAHNTHASFRQSFEQTLIQLLTSAHTFMQAKACTTLTYMLLDTQADTALSLL